VTSLSPAFSLLYFLVRLVFAALAAKLAHLQALRRGFLVLGAGVVSVLAFSALKCDDFPHFVIPRFM
jgi:hypothetical protein